MVASALTALPHLLNENRFTDALDTVYSVAPAFVASIQEWRVGADPLQADFDVEAALGPRDGDPWRKVEDFAADQGVVPTFMRLATLATQDVVAARTFAAEVSAACHGISENSVQPQRWLDLSEQVGQIFTLDGGGNALIAEGLEMMNAGDAVPGLIRIIGGTFQPDAAIRSAAGAHLSVAIHLTTLASDPTSSVYRNVILPFFFTYWDGAFDKNRFQFTTPRLVEQQIADAHQAPFNRRLQLLLQAIIDGLSINRPEAARRWLSLP